MTVSIGYVGLEHHHAIPYLESIERLDAEVTAYATPYANGISETDTDRLASTPRYDDSASMLDDMDVDLLWVTAANRDTPEIIRNAVEHGVDVFSEKPAGRTAAELESVTAAVANSDATVGLSYTWRGHPISRQLRELAQDGFYGDVRGFDLRFVASALAHRDTNHFLFDTAASRGGIVQWLGVHWIDLLPWVLDDPVVRVNASMTSNTRAVDIEDGATLQFETSSGAIGTHTCGYYLREGRYDTTFNVYGDEGHSRWDPMGQTFGFDGETTLELDSSSASWTATPHREIVHEYAPTPGYGGKWGLSFFQQFLDACDGSAPNPADLGDALQVLRVLDAVYTSADTGEWTQVKHQ